MSPAANTLLWLCLDGLRGTQQCSVDELARLSDALRVVESMAALQRTVQRVRLVKTRVQGQGQAQCLLCVLRRPPLCAIRVWDVALTCSCHDVLLGIDLPPCNLLNGMQARWLPSP